MAFEILISDTASTQDTVDLIIKTVNEHEHSKFIQDFCKILKPEKSEAFLKRVFDTVCHYIKYERDPSGHERVKTPKRLFVDAYLGKEGGDCKKMSTAIASLLKCAGIEPLLKVISYDGKTWAHIYVICKVGNQWYILDPVNNCKFNSEIPHVDAVVYNLKGNSMNLSLLGGQDNGVKNIIYSGVSGVQSDIDNASATLFGGRRIRLYDNSLGCCKLSGSEVDELVKFYMSRPQNQMNGIGNLWDKIKNAAQTVYDKVTNVVNNVVDGIKTVNPVSILMRNSFLGILRLGKALENTPIKMHLAKKLATQWQTDGGAKLKSWWKDKWGGDPDSLKAAIVAGSGTQLSGPDSRGYFQVMGLSGLGEPVTIATVGAAIAAATPILMGVHLLLKELGIINKSEDDALAATTDAGIAAHTTGGKLPTATQLAAAQILPISPENNLIKQLLKEKAERGSVTGLALVMMLNEFPIFISLPIVAYTLYHYRKIWTAYIPFINHK